MTTMTHDIPAVPGITACIAAEAAGTFLLVFALVGAASYTAVFPDEHGTLGIGLLGVAVTLGLVVMIGASAFGPVSGGHFNPAVTIALAVAGRHRWADVGAYVLAQFVGGTLGAAVLLLLAGQGSRGFLAATLDGGFASNGYGSQSPAGFTLLGVAIAETVGTALFATVILRVTGPRGSAVPAPVVIGATLTILLLTLIPISNASLNPARSFATAVFAGPEWLAQWWAFLVFPVLGGAIAGAAARVRATER
ncbi:aquaporin [Curtobacterium sp. UNCCL20]|uniref:aquaporin n=1 Tax=Curtobacterium sp. UNCCL20 TaxID=1502773 RepID=UPI0020C84E2E|nr:aquaporin [Curtobacterium sp. UNCCL20]